VLWVCVFIGAAGAIWKPHTRSICMHINLAVREQKSFRATPRAPSLMQLDTLKSHKFIWALLLWVSAVLCALIPAPAAAG